MSILINDSGIYKEPGMILVNDGGVWKEVGGGGLPTAPGPLVGESYGGGYVVNGYHYVVNGPEITVSGGPEGGYLYIVADVSSETMLRSKNQNSRTAEAESETDGWANTIAASTSIHPAGKYCRDYRGGGFDDWFLPAKDELNLFWIHIAPSRTTARSIFGTSGSQKLTTHSAAYYWSSTQRSTSNTWRQEFSTGVASQISKTDTGTRVRPVRKIPFNP